MKVTKLRREDEELFESERQAVIARRKRSRELNALIFKDFSTFVQDPRSKETTSFLRYGLQVDAGWFQVVIDLMHELRKIGERHQVFITFTQVKQKFGELRVYFTYQHKEPTTVSKNRDEPDPIMADILTEIDIATTRARAICELCGARPAQLRQRPLTQTLCDSCSDHVEKVPLVIRARVLLSITDDDLTD